MRFFSETLVASILLVLLLWFINPLDLWMTNTLHMTLLGVIVACFAIFSMFVWKESVNDERMILHRYVAARFASMAIGVVLLLGTVLQSLSHRIDPWLPGALAIMVGAKIVGRLYAERKY